MKTSIEIEYKTLISEDTYHELLRSFNLEDNIFHQINFYFDTDDFYLRQNNMALRIRHKGNIYKLTLKRPHDDGCLYEDSILLTKEKALEMIEKGFVPEAYGINKEVKMKATLETNRVSTPFEDGKLFFDQSIYAGEVDYEVEYEASDLKQGLKTFKSFLKEHKIPYKTGKHKIDRVYEKLGL